MKKIIIIILGLLPYVIYGQIYLRYTTKPLPIQKEMISAMDSIYPGVKLLYRSTSETGFALIDMEYSNDTVRLEDGFVELLLKCKKNNQSATFSDITSVKVFAYLDFLSSQAINNQSEFADVLSINIRTIRKTINYNQEPLFNDTSAKFNYCVELNVEPCKFRKYRFEHYKTKLKYYINAYKGIVRYFYVEQTTENGIINSKLIKTLAAFDTKKRIDEYSDNLQKSTEGILGTWDQIRINKENNDDAFQIVNHNTINSYAIVTSINGSPTNARCNFEILNMDPAITNPILKIYTDTEFGSRELIWQSLLGSNGITINSYTPQDNTFDGFCKFEIYDGTTNTLIKEIQKSYICLIKSTTVSLNSDCNLRLRYANRFFPTGTNVNTYLNNLQQYYSDTWQHQIVTFNLNQGQPPSTTNSIYYLELNPYTQLNYYWYGYNKYSSDIYEAGYPLQRIMGMTSDPTAVMPSIGCSYSTSEQFLRTAISHEFYHGLQFTFFSGIGPYIDGNKWIIEGQARAIQAIEYPDYEFATNNNSFFKIDANKLISEPTKSLKEYDYKYCLFWLSLYQNYTASNQTQPQKLSIFRETIQDYSQTTIEQMGIFMDMKLNLPNNYDFMADAIANFHYRMLLNNSTDYTWNPPFANDFLNTPSTISHTYTPTVHVDITNTLSKSYGASFYEINFVNQGDLWLRFNGDPSNNGVCADYSIQLKFENSILTYKSIKTTEGLASLMFTVPSNNSKAYLIITRTDKYEETTSVTGRYRLKIEPNIPPDVFEVDFDIIANKSSTYIQYVDKTNLGNETILSYNWEFPEGNPSTSTEQNPIVEYVNSGTYSSTLIVTTQSGKQDIKMRVNYLNTYEPNQSGTGDIIFIASNSPFIQNCEAADFNISIIEGVGPFDILIQFGDGTSYSYHGDELFFATTHYYNAQGYYGINYTISGPEGSGQIPSYYHSEIYVGNPGSHQTFFTYEYSVPGQQGTGCPVYLHDMTTGGYQPYYKWEWVYGRGLKTNTQVQNSNGDYFEMYYEEKEPFSITFDQFDTYPITLIVTDQSGFQIAYTRYIEVTEATKCLILNPELIRPYNSQLKKHIVRKENGDYISYVGRFSEYFPHLYSQDPDCIYCRTTYPPTSYNTGSINNVITNVSYKLTMNDFLWEYKTDVMHPDYEPSYGDQWDPNYSFYGPERYWEGWYEGHYEPNSGTNYCIPWAFADSYEDYNFTETGKYNLLVEYWNKESVFNPSPDNDKNNSMYNHFNIPIYCVDCDENLHVNFPSIISESFPDGFLSGNIFFADQHNVVITSPQISYEACNEILMKPGLSIMYGSNFLATITQFDPLPKLPEMTVTENSDLTVSDVECFPIPNDGNFIISGIQKFKNIEICNSLGEHVSFELFYSNGNGNIKMLHPGTGLYFVKITTITGELIVRKVVVINM